MAAAYLVEKVVAAAGGSNCVTHPERNTWPVRAAKPTGLDKAGTAWYVHVLPCLAAWTLILNTPTLSIHLSVCLSHPNPVLVFLSLLQNILGLSESTIVHFSPPDRPDLGHLNNPSQALAVKLLLPKPPLRSPPPSPACEGGCLGYSDLTCHYLISVTNVWQEWGKTLMPHSNLVLLHIQTGRPDPHWLVVCKAGGRARIGKGEGGAGGQLQAHIVQSPDSSLNSKAVLRAWVSCKVRGEPGGEARQNCHQTLHSQPPPTTNLAVHQSPAMGFQPFLPAWVA